MKEKINYRLITRVKFGKQRWGKMLPESYTTYWLKIQDGLSYTLHLQSVFWLKLHIIILSINLGHIFESTPSEILIDNQTSVAYGGFGLGP